MQACQECGRITRRAHCPAHDPKRHYRTPEHRANARHAQAQRGQRCPDCGRPMLRPSADHVIAIAAGGGNEQGNSRVACLSCNSSRKAKPLAR